MPTQTKWTINSAMLDAMLNLVFVYAEAAADMKCGDLSVTITAFPIPEHRTRHIAVRPINMAGNTATLTFTPVSSATVRVGGF